MRQYLQIGIVLIITLLLISCTSHRNPFKGEDLTRETWQRDIERNDRPWRKGADAWFFTGEPTATESANRSAPYSAAISTTEVRVPDFANVRANGSFQVQIFGTDGHNTVYVYGPNAGVSNVSVAVQGNTLSVRQIDPNVPLSSMKRVIIRIGMQHLNKLIQNGCGTIEVIRIISNRLDIASSGCGNIYVAGTVSLRHVDLSGSGSISVFNTHTPSLIINSSGSGNVNVSGNIGIESITHHGSGNINIIGANSNCLDVYADGSGKIGILGIVKLRRVTAKDETCVFIDSVLSDCITAEISGKARVGIAGVTKDLYVYTSGTAVFEGKNLCASSAYVKSYDDSHANVTASNKLFALASQDSTIYFFGPANLVAEFNGKEGAVIPMGGRNWCNYNSEYRPYSYTYSHVGETLLYQPNYQLRNKEWVARYRGEG